MGKVYSSPVEQLQKTGSYKATFGSYDSFEEAKNAGSSMIQNGGAINSLFRTIDSELGLQGCNVNVEPVNLGDSGKYTIMVSIEKTYDMGGKGSK